MIKFEKCLWFHNSHTQSSGEILRLGRWAHWRERLSLKNTAHPQKPFHIWRGLDTECRTGESNPIGLSDLSGQLYLLLSAWAGVKGGGWVWGLELELGLEFGGWGWGLVGGSCWGLELWVGTEKACGPRGLGVNIPDSDSGVSVWELECHAYVSGFEFAADLIVVCKFSFSFSLFFLHKYWVLRNPRCINETKLQDAILSWAGRACFIFN